MKKTIKDLCQQIATAHNLEGNETLDIYFSFIPDHITSEGQIKELMNFSGHNEFSTAGLKECVESFALLLGSITTILNLRQMLKKKETKIHPDLIKSSWKNRLLAEGMDESKAEAIVSSFSSDLQLLLGEK
ncbi:MAG: hypothetical protein V4604_09145 [Bacteroidota bacterium]